MKKIRIFGDSNALSWAPNGSENQNDFNGIGRQLNSYHPEVECDWRGYGGAMSTTIDDKTWGPGGQRIPQYLRTNNHMSYFSSGVLPMCCDADLVFVMLGTNDSGWGVSQEEYRTAMSGLIGQLLSWRVQSIVLLGATPFNGDPGEGSWLSSPEQNELLDGYRVAQEDLVRSFSKQVQSSMQVKRGEDLRDWIDPLHYELPDTAHWNEDGHTAAKDAALVSVPNGWLT